MRIRIKTFEGSYESIDTGALSKLIMPVDYLLHESSVGYAVSVCSFVRKMITDFQQIFKVKIQADAIGSRQKEVQTKVQDLALFSMFAPCCNTLLLCDTDPVQVKWFNWSALLLSKAQVKP